MNQSSASFLFLMLPMVLVPLVAVWGWNVLPRSSIDNPSSSPAMVTMRQGFFITCLVLMVAIYFIFYSGMVDSRSFRFHVALIFASILCFCLILSDVLALSPRNSSTMFSMPDRNLRCQAFLFILISFITITCACFRSNIYWKQSAFRYEYDFEYYGAARITAQRYTDQEQDDDDAQAADDDNNDNEAQTDLWTSVEWMCPNYGKDNDGGGTLCQQELASICPDNTAMSQYQKWWYTNFGQVRVYNADGVVEECDANLVDLISSSSNDDDDNAYDSNISPQKDGSPYLYVVANCSVAADDDGGGACSARFAGGQIQSDYKESRLALRAGYTCLGLSLVGLLGLVGMTVYYYKCSRKQQGSSSTNSDAGVELLPASAQGEVT